MQGSSLEQLLLQVAFSFAFCVAFRAMGVMLLQMVSFRQEDEQSGYAGIFYSTLAGILLVVLLYSVAVSSFKTINILLLAAGFFFLKRRPAARIPRIRFERSFWYSLGELLLLSAVFVVLLHLLPEGEYKQKDSFFYLKISEALTITGQENANNYFNSLDPAYHGVEWYHYFELWLNAFLLRFTQHWLPNIQTFRVVCYTILSVVFVNGLFYLYEVMAGRKIRFAEKLFCFSFLFFMPDVFPYLPHAVRRLMTFNFENNYLERPNFRVIYLFFLPVIAGLWEKKYDGRLFFFLLCGCVVHPAVFLGVLPAVAGFVILSFRKYDLRPPVVYRREMGVFFLFIALYGLFYILFSGRGVPAMYHTGVDELALYYSKSWRYVLLTIFCSLLYCLVLAGAAWLIFKYLGAPGSREAVKRNPGLTWFLALVVVCSIVVARMLGFMENLYQVAYTAFITVSLFIFILFVQVARRGTRYALPLVALVVSGYVANRIATPQLAVANVSYRNGQQCYGGVTYSTGYLKQVIAFMKRAGNCAGGYIADSAYYRPLYYSNRNPAIYHLPLTYIIANNVTTNIDYCLSAEDAILYNGTGSLQHNVYLRNAIARSWYHRHKTTACGGVPDTACAAAFALQNRLRYLVLTPGIKIDSMLAGRITAIFTDDPTGERFLVLQ